MNCKDSAKRFQLAVEQPRGTGQGHWRSSRHFEIVRSVDQSWSQQKQSESAVGATVARSEYISDITKYDVGPTSFFVVLLLIGAGYMRHPSIEFSWLGCFLEGEGAILTWTNRGLCAIRYPPCIGLEVGHGVAIDNGPYSYFFEEHHLHAASSTFQYFDLVLHWDC